MAAAYPSTRRTPIYEGTRIPHPIPTVLEVDPKLREQGDILEVNFGPNHPSTHGVLRLIVELNGERVEGLAAVIGYLHTGFEKNMEAKTYWKGITYAPRMDYVSFQANELVYVLAVEKLLGIEIAAQGRLDADAPLRAEPDPLAPRLPRHLRARAGGRFDVLVLLPRAGRDPRPLRDGLRVPHAHAVLPDRRARRGHPARLLRRLPRVLRRHAGADRRVRGDPQHAADLARADEGHRAPLRRGCDRARAVRPGAARVRRRLGSPQGRAVPGVRRGRLRRSRSIRTATCSTATRCASTRCASRCGSSASASTGCRTGRGSPTTARSCCRRATSCTRRWRASSTTSSSSPRASGFPRARST